MKGGLPACWELKQCGRQKGGPSVAQLGECVASVEGLGHSCWVIAGTLCGDVVQGTFAEKQGTCMACEVYRRYHRTLGTDGPAVIATHPDEQARYQRLMNQRLRALKTG